MMGRGLWSNHERSFGSSSSRRSWHLLLLLVAGLNSTKVVALDANPKSAFTFPDQDGMTFHLNDVVLVSYVSSFPEPELYAWCRESDGVKQVFTKIPAAGFNGTQPVTIDFTSDGDCWWNLRRIFNTPDGANGATFKLSASERDGGPQTISRESPKPTPTTAIKSPPSPNFKAQSSTTTSTSTSSLTTPTGSSTSSTSTTSILRTNPTASSTLSTSTTTSTAPTGTNTPSNANESQNNTAKADTNNSSGGGLSTGAAAGIGVAVGVVILILLIALVIYLRKWKSNVIAEAVKASSNAASPAGTPPYPVYASLGGNHGGIPGGGQMTQTQIAQGQAVEANSSFERLGPGAGLYAGPGAGAYQAYQSYQAYPGGGGQQQLKPPEEMDVERHTAEMEGDFTYGNKFQREQYR